MTDNDIKDTPENETGNEATYEPGVDHRQAAEGINADIVRYNRYRFHLRYLLPLIILLCLASLYFYLDKPAISFRLLSTKESLDKKIALSEDGTLIFLSCCDSVDNRFRNIMVSRDTAKHFKPLSEKFSLPGPITVFELSPDKQNLFIGDSTQLFSLKLNPAAELVDFNSLNTLPGSEIWGVHLVPGSDQLAMYGDWGSLKLINYKTLTESKILYPADHEILSLDFDPGQNKIKALLYSRSQNKREIRSVDSLAIPIRDDPYKAPGFSDMAKKPNLRSKKQ